jgi:hypothetical protein
MMVSCPKCGFTQPQDRYCANCGIDMVNYRPAQAPFMIRLLKSVLFQVLILALMIGGGFTFLRYKNRMALEERIAKIEHASDTRLIEQHFEKSESASQSTTLAEQAPGPAASDESEAPGSLAPAALNEKRAASEEPQTVGAAAPAPAPSASPSAPAATAVTGTERPAVPTTVQVRFVEMNRKLLSDLMAESKDQGGYGPFMTGIVTNAETRLKPSQELKTLDTEPFEQSLRLNQPVVAFRGTRDEGTGLNLGITVNVTPTAIDEAGVHMQVEAYRVLREPPGSNPPVGEQTFPEQFTIPRGGAAFLAGTFPRRPLSPEDATLYSSHPVLRILNSGAFKDGTVDFVILIEPR